MSDNKFTPGPWQVETAGYGSEKGFFPEELFVSIDGANMAICSDVVDPVTGELSPANASLIAAAPDLLEALEMVMDCGSIDICKAIEMARAAIARARGEA